MHRISLQRVSVILGQMRMSSTAGAEEDALFEKINSTGIITLNRPKALNALDFSMVKKITPKLKVSHIKYHEDHYLLSPPP